MAYLKLLRPLNCILAATGVFVASVVTIGLGVLQGSYLLPILIASLSAALVTGAGNVLNDYLDRQTDKLNHPDRPIPSGRISPKAALYYSILLFLVPLPLSLIVRIECFLIVVFNIIVLISYERYFKRRGLIGNLEVSWLTGSIFIFGGFAAYQGNISLLLRTVYLALLAFFASLGREIAKDIQDVPGDIDRQTLPRRMGVKGAADIATICFLIAVLFSFVPPVIGILSLHYIPLVIVADIIFIYCTSLLMKDPRKAGDVAKVGMVVALFAFLLGGLLGGAT